MVERKIAILDDDEMFCAYAMALCREAGLDARITGQASVSELLRVDPDYVLLDLLMPEVDGIQLISQMAERGLKSKVILVSSVSKSLLQACREFADMAGVPIIGVLDKPFELKALLRLIGSISTRKRQATTTLPDSTVRRLLDSKCLQVQYQPKINLTSGRVDGLEALVRLVDPTTGQLIMPIRFLDAMERGPLVWPFARLVIEQVLCQISDWIAEHGRQWRVAINVPLSILRRKHLPEWLASRAAEHGVSSSSLQLEITERTVSTDFLTVLKTLLRLRLMGLGVSIDDFGMGFSSAERLRQLPVTEVKIDHALVAGLPKTVDEVKSAVALGRQLKLDVIAEGVETEHQAEFLAALGCTHAQGYHFAPPMNNYDVQPWIAEFENAPRPGRIASS